MRTLPLLLPLLLAASAVAATPVWIDTDPSVAAGAHEVDDGFALAQAFHSPELAIRGVSIVFGNAELNTAIPIGREIVRRFGPANLPFFTGAASGKELGVETGASRAIAQALRKEKLTILALGPATNVATVLRLHPELRSRVVAVIAVAGRRPGQHFTTGNKGGKPFRDFNFEMDPAAFQTILDSGVPLVLAPWEISSKVWLTAEDLEMLRRKNAAMEWLYRPALDWLDFWTRSFGVNGFNPFDTLAVAFVTTPGLLQCKDLPVGILTLPDDSGAAGATKPYLVVDPKAPPQRHANYCYEPKPGFKADLLKRLEGNGGKGST